MKDDVEVDGFKEDDEPQLGRVEGFKEAAEVVDIWTGLVVGVMNGLDIGVSVDAVVVVLIGDDFRKIVCLFHYTSINIIMTYNSCAKRIYIRMWFAYRTTYSRHN